MPAGLRAHVFANKGAQRLIAQGGVLVDEVTIDSTRHALDASAG